MFIRRYGSWIEILTPAKLNLFLEILARREDGFHELETLMQAVAIYDSLSVSANREGRLNLSCDWGVGWAARATARTIAGATTGPTTTGPTTTGPTTNATNATDEPFGDLPVGADNIVLRALERLRERAGVEAGADVRLVKRIPAAAGLGGASSDAAAALVAGCQVWRIDWSPEQLSALAAELGSDIPFFLGAGQRGTGSAVCRGRGERIESVEGMPHWHFVVVRPPVGLSTPQVFRRCRPADSPRAVAPLIAAARRGDWNEVGRRLHNRLQEPAESLSPWIARVRDAFARLPFVGHRMSGSGSSYFGIARHAAQARRLAADLCGAGLGAVYCTSTAPAAGRKLGTT